MKRVAILFFLAAFPGMNSFAQEPSQLKGDACRIVDMVAKKVGEVDYVDGKKVPGNVVTIDYLREQEKSSPRTCLLVFVTSATRIKDIEGLRVIAGKMQYKDFRAYLYDANRDSVSDINAGEVRKGPNGPIPWPDDPKR
jgi:hypothetical protein